MTELLYKEDEKRLFLRNELREHNKQLVETAQQAGVETTFDFAIFQNHGYKGLEKKQKILDHMGSTELAASRHKKTLEKSLG